MDNGELSKLIHILQLAYSGELAAAHAYRGHWHSVRDNSERERIHQIEEEEWHHRNLVGGILIKLNAQPDPKRERRAILIGRSLQFLCHVTGWLLPMYMAGRLESRNIREYETAARHAANSGHPEMIDCLLTMAEVEWEHEKYFRDRVLTHWIGSRLRLWPLPESKQHIRSSFPQKAV
jgi:rubrerythrin